MNIYDKLKSMTDFRKPEYFKWKHNIRYDQTLPKKTESEFLKAVDRKTMNGFLVWEKSSEYKQLLAMYLDSCIANDLDVIYKKVVEKAKEGDANSVKLFLQLSKEINSVAKQTITIQKVDKTLKVENEDVVVEEDVEEDNLEL